MVGRSFSLFLFLLFFLVVSTSAQFGRGVSEMDHRLRVHIMFADEGGCDASTKVDLMKSASMAFARGSTDKSCVAEFFGVPGGTYFLEISGHGFSNLASSEIIVSSPFNDSVEVTVRRPEKNRDEDTALRSAETSVADLRIPARAAKEFNNANRQMEQQNWTRALATLRKASSIYPQYAAAYVNLGVIYARIGDRKHEAEALQQAIVVDDHRVLAYVNLARMHIALNAFPEAEMELKKAAALDPTDGVILVLLGHAEFMNHELDDAIAICRTVHAMPGVPHAYAHWVAAFAFEQKDQIAEAGNEFRTYVKEQPTGARVDDARKELANIANFLAGK